ncbi:hypothetical protein [Desmospora profundinema]|uniref:Uncharacterized protein n=1 Tax=Desmospora profundinema TaxID=1571184 RepID=A0ABU1IQJ4_9BACL|nr:hypothetical protein [Desmospora profundinema]MDR6227059.1 hypothetical protein [Desmospora profundinema]
MKSNLSKKIALLFLSFYLFSLFLPAVGMVLAQPHYQLPEQYQAPEKYQAPEQYQAPEKYQAPEQYQSPEKYQAPEKYQEPDKYTNNGNDPNNSESNNGGQDGNNHNPGFLEPLDPYFDPFTSYTGNIYDGIKGFPKMLAGANGFYLTHEKLPHGLGGRWAYAVHNKDLLKLSNVPILKDLVQSGSAPSYSKYIGHTHSAITDFTSGGFGSYLKGNVITGALLNTTNTVYGTYRDDGWAGFKSVDFASEFIVDIGLGAGAAVVSTAAGAGAAALIGATVGSVVPGFGTAVGFAVGVGISMFLNSDMGKKYVKEPLVNGTKKAINATIDTGKKALDGLKSVGSKVSSWFG